jgi:hypothetical protein
MDGAVEEALLFLDLTTVAKMSSTSKPHLGLSVLEQTQNMGSKV